jgi:hydrophobic/amphiphilic exporter-1 (mainly G- bacteria), HAE1 family
MSEREPIVESVCTRIRPIYMSIINTVCAMLPPGAGSEFYRGLGSVVVVGPLVSTVISIFIIPAFPGLVFNEATGIRKYF